MRDIAVAGARTVGVGVSEGGTGESLVMLLSLLIMEEALLLIL